VIKVTLGVSSSISLYKSLEIIRRFKERDCDVRVIMTENAAKLVSPLTFETISQNPVAIDLFAEKSSYKIGHIELAKWEDIFVVAPATANVIGKFASGIADDFLTTHFISSTSKKVIAPAMNGRMWRNEIVKKNVAKLKEQGIMFIGPKEGNLACGEEDIGALEEPTFIVEEALSLLKEKNLKGKKILVTAGATREFLDGVRFLSNPSSGKMGFSIADEARKMGATVTLIYGSTLIEPPKGVKTIKVTSTSEMEKAVLENFENCDFLFMCAAPSDFTFEKKFNNKLKRAEGEISIVLKPTSDILKKVREIKKKGQIVCGFSAETEDFLKNAKRKLEEKGLDFIVLNDVSRKDIGFESDYNEVKIISSSGEIKEIKKDLKRNIAEKIVNEVLKIEE
jgi:phosphopantothenoylcysteine decarboxylase/phosphopantothenate--cysteine ligase